MPFHKKSIDYSRSTIDVKKGYTLIEFLIVLGILSVSITSVFLILTSVIKGSNQANIGAEVKQNGQAVLEDLERQIRSATDVTAITGGGLTPSGITANSGLSLTSSSGQVALLCINAVGTTSNGWIAIYKRIVSTESWPPTDGTKYQSLTNTDIVSGVDIDCTAGTAGSKAFQANPLTSSTKVVTIAFTANQGVNAPSRVDYMANAKFQTVVSLRQY